MPQNSLSQSRNGLERDLLLGFFHSRGDVEIFSNFEGFPWSFNGKILSAPAVNGPSRLNLLVLELDPICDSYQNHGLLTRKHCQVGLN